MARDCTVNRDPNAPPPPIGGPSPPGGNMIKGGGFDSEYASLMAELGESGRGGGEPGKTSWAGPNTGHDITAGGSNIPPWRRPEVWQTNTQPQQQSGYRPLQQGYGGGYGGATAGYGGQQWGQAGYPQAAGYGHDQNYAQYYQGQYAQQQQVGTPSH